MRLTTRTNLAMRTLMFCAINGPRNVRKSEIAAYCNASENHLAQVIRLLGQRGFIDAMRGRNGGLKLAREPGKINVGDVFRTFESDLPFAECFTREENHCPLTDCCWLRPALKHAVEAFYQSLDKLALTDLVDGNTDLHKTLSMEASPDCNRTIFACPAHA